MIENLEPGTYYQDILADGSRSVLRQKFPVLKRVSFDRQSPVIQTLVIKVTDLEDDICTPFYTINLNMPDAPARPATPGAAADEQLGDDINHLFGDKA